MLGAQLNEKRTISGATVGGESVEVYMTVKELFGRELPEVGTGCTVCSAKASKFWGKAFISHAAAATFVVTQNQVVLHGTRL